MAKAKKTNETTHGSSAKAKDVRSSCIVAAMAVADMVRTSLGPRGADKMIKAADNTVTISNDGATILSMARVYHPAGRMLVDLSKSQDIEAGDGTTSVVVIAGALLKACAALLAKGVHPTRISEALSLFGREAQRALVEMSMPLDLNDRDAIVRAARTSLASKLVASHSEVLGPIAVDSVLSVVDSFESEEVDLRRIRVVKMAGGTIDDTELIKGLVFTQGASRVAGGPTRVENAKVGLIQFCLSAPKTDMDSQIVVTDYTQMDRILKEERQYILKLVKAIKKSGCNVLLVQKSILRDAVSELALHFLAKLKIMVVQNVERDEVPFLCDALGCRPMAHPDAVSPEKLSTVKMVEEIPAAGGSYVKMTGLAHVSKTISVLVRGTSGIVVDEAERSLHDAICVVRSLVKKKALLVGGGAPEVEMSLALERYSKTLAGVDSYCVRTFADALDVIPYTLAENAGMRPINIVTELRARHARGDKYAGINVRKGTVTDMRDEGIVQPLLVNWSAVQLATECTRLIMKLDDIINVR